MLLAAVILKLVPVIVTGVPTTPLVGEKDVIVGLCAKHNCAVKMKMARSEMANKGNFCCFREYIFSILKCIKFLNSGNFYTFKSVNFGAPDNYDYQKKLGTNYHHHIVGFSDTLPTTSVYIKPIPVVSTQSYLVALHKAIVNTHEKECIEALPIAGIS